MFMLMDSIVVNNVEELYLHSKNHNIKIYGAKTIAQRVCHYLESRGGITVDAFVVSNRYKNPDTFQGKPVLRIEDEKIEYDCMIVAVSGAFIRNVEKELQKYSIKKLIVISPLMDDEFPTSCILSRDSNVSERAFLSDKIQVISDDTSSITIGDNAIIKEGTVILANDGSHIHIKEGTFIGEKVFISAGDHSEIEIMPYSGIGEKTHITAKEESYINLNSDVSVGERVTFISSKKSSISVGAQSAVCESCFFSLHVNSELSIGNETTIGARCVIDCSFDASVTFKGENSISESAHICASRKSIICIGRKTISNPFMYMASEEGTFIDIGEDNMISFFVKMNVGSHKIVNRQDRKDITNRKPIKTGKHVWIGMGATLLPGCNVDEGSIVGASAVVNKYIPKYSACVGTTARIVKSNIEWDRNDPPIIL